MKGYYFTILFLLGLLTQSFAGEITGTVRDYRNGNSVSQVKVSLNNSFREAVTDEEGMYRFKDIETGKYILKFVHPNYHSYTTEIEISDDSKLKFDVELKPNVTGENQAEYQVEQPKYILDDITVSTTRASRDHPVTYTNLNSEEVQERNYGQDLPLLFSELPNLNAYSDGGNGIGYSYLRMRGFSQNRVGVQVNGVPLNDAESHEVFWVDLPDFAKDLQDVQVQRGVGSSLYGSAALGGSINLVTATPGLADRAMIRAEGSYGSWNTRRASVQFQSGRIQNRYGVSARLTRMASEGYRDNSWTRLWSYHISGARFTPKHTTKLVFYGGPERLHLAYEGIPKDSLKTNRAFNPLTYNGEVDNFFQPHYELHDEWKLSERTEFYNTFYLFRGDGYYDQYRPETDIAKIFYNLSDDTTTFDLLRRRNVGESDWGWIPRVSSEHGYGTTTVGADLRIHSAHHEGIVLWGNPLPQGIQPDYHYYNYRVNKRNLSGFVHNLFEITQRLRGMADLQIQSQQYKMKDDQLFGVALKQSFHSVNPRVGLNYLLIQPNSKTNRPAGLIYVNLSWAQREPAFSDLYDPQDYYSLPISAPNRFEAINGGYRYIGPTLKPEKLTNLELGTHFQWEQAHIGLNYYYMALMDEIVPYAGQLDDNGVPVSGNADKTLHQGIELVGAISPISCLNFSGNLALTDHHFVNYQEWNWSTYDFVSRNGNRLAQDSPYLANLRSEFKYENFLAAISFRAIGKQFIDNSENNSSEVPAYSLLNADLSYRFTQLGNSVKAIELKLRVNNLLNKEYESFGYADYDDGSPRYMVGSPRAVYTTLAVEL